jgi:hypothetical protein
MISSIDGKTLKILGKNDAVIYINNKKTNMDSEALIEMLKSTPSEDIQKIEVITVPGSEFQVESKEGVINIVMKKNKNNGYNGTMKMQNEQAYYNNPNAGGSFNFRQGKWSGILISEWAAGRKDKIIHFLMGTLLSEMNLMDTMMIPIKISVAVSTLTMKSTRNKVLDSRII